MSQGLMGDEDMAHEGSIFPDMVPLTRAGTEEDAGGALIFMCSRAGAYTSKLLKCLGPYCSCADS